MSYAAENRFQSNARDCRWDSDLSQMQLATAAGVGLETVRKLERGEVVGMKIETILRVSAALEVAPADLLPSLGVVTDTGALPPRRRRVRRPVSERRNRRGTA